jgi:hypothetical protein
MAALETLTDDEFITESSQVWRIEDGCKFLLIVFKVEVF